MTQQFKKGDRVKVEFEGEVQFVGPRSVDIKVGERVETVYAKSITLLDRPVEPLAPGSVVRNRTGDTWFVGKQDVVFVTILGKAWPASASATRLAEMVQVQPDHYTLLHDGSATT